MPKQTARDGNRWLKVRSAEASIAPRRTGSSTGSCAPAGANASGSLVGLPAGLGPGPSVEEGRC